MKKNFIELVVSLRCSLPVPDSCAQQTNNQSRRFTPWSDDLFGVSPVLRIVWSSFKGTPVQFG
jgi:hypothetical protein